MVRRLFDPHKRSSFPVVNVKRLVGNEWDRDVLFRRRVVDDPECESFQPGRYDSTDAGGSRQLPQLHLSRNTTMRIHAIAAALLSGTVLSSAAFAQVAEKANAGYKTKEDRARVARNLDNPDRVERQKPVELLEAIGVEPGQAIADIGTGVGFMLPYMIDAVGPSGRVYAEDIQDDFLEKVKQKATEAGWKNIDIVKGAQKDVELPKNSVDLAFILDVYHHLNYPEETMATVYEAVKPGGRLAVIDFYRSREHPRMSEERRKNHIRLDRDGFKKEIEAVGFQFDRTFDHLPYQYVLVFKK